MTAITTASATATASEIPSAVAGSAKARLVEFLLVGGLTPFLFPLSYALRRAVGLDAADLAVGFTAFYAAWIINDPHFSVTYLLFYRGARERALGSVFGARQRVLYVLAGFLAPALLVLWAGVAIALRSAPALGGMVELMYLLVGWHYVKQGFGVLTVLATRRGVRFSAGERAAVLAHCYAGWAYAWANPAVPQRELEEKGLVYLGLPHPAWLERIALAFALGTLAWMIVALSRKYRRERSLPLLTPLVALVCSVWAWSVYSSLDPLVRYVVPALHSVQYLYVVRLLEQGRAREREGPPWFDVSARVRVGVLAVGALGLGVLLFHAGPSLLDAALWPRALHHGPLGPTPYFAALYAIVNLHHYFMDAVLWRRANPDTRYLFA